MCPAGAARRRSSFSHHMALKLYFNAISVKLKFLNITIHSLLREQGESHRFSLQVRIGFGWNSLQIPPGKLVLVDRSTLSKQSLLLLAWSYFLRS